MKKNMKFKDLEIGQRFHVPCGSRGDIQVSLGIGIKKSQHQFEWEDKRFASLQIINTKYEVIPVTEAQEQN